MFLDGRDGGGEGEGLGDVGVVLRWVVTVRDDLREEEKSKSDVTRPRCHVGEREELGTHRDTQIIRSSEPFRGDDGRTDLEKESEAKKE